MKTIREAATALCDRWDTPLWKDVEHTAMLVHSLRTALAQPWPDLTKRDRESYQKGHAAGVAHHKQALQPEQKRELTNAELQASYDNLFNDKETEPEPLEYWNAVEGWVKIDEMREHLDSVGCGTIYKTAGEGRIPLCTIPPNHEWVDLTDEQMEALEVRYMSSGQSAHEFLEAVKNALKENNT